jgi:hypothetical protein
MQSLPEQLQEKIRDFSDIFKQIKIGDVTSTGGIIVNKSYIGQIEEAITKVFDGAVVRELEENSRGYIDLKLLFQLLALETTDFDGLKRIIVKRFPDKYIKTRLSAGDLPQKLVKYIEFYEEEIIEYLIKMLSKGRKGGKRGGAVPEDLRFLQQMTKQSYNLENPQEWINGWTLKRWTPTMKFWMKGKSVIVGVRGTKTTEDVMTWGTIPLNRLDTTGVYKRDKAELEQFQEQYLPSEYTYYAVGHSLGGAIIDNFIRAGLIKEAVTYNPAIQSRDINAGLPNRRIYYGNDPLYRLMGWWDRKSEHRKAEDKSWGDFLYSFTAPGMASEALSAHNLKNFNFTGGVKCVKK